METPVLPCEICQTATEELLPCPCELGRECPVSRTRRRLERRGVARLAGICLRCHTIVHRNAIDRRLDFAVARAVS
jgi:hypothetical protein